jgi:hypothetical protein
VSLRPLRSGQPAASSSGSIRRFRVSHSDSMPGWGVRLAKAGLW